MKACGWIELHLGTRVEIAAHAESESSANPAIEAAFREVALIHRLIEFHRNDSDVSRLNSRGAHGPVTVDPRTVQVVRAACALSERSDGHFDITVAPALVKAGHLPVPASACEPREDATWRDIEILGEDALVFHRPLWIDLGGIAKGFAVDRAFQACSDALLTRCRVNAGGDIRLADDVTGAVTLEVPGGGSAATACVELCGGSIASSCGSVNASVADGVMRGPHFDGVTRAGVDPRRFVSVLAEDCMSADALTKVVLVLGERAQPVLAQYGATAFVYDEAGGWRQLPPVA